MLNISQKKELVERVSKQLAEAEIAILVDYKGLDVAAVTELRAKLREAGVQMEVVKNTLLNLASKGASSEVMADFFKGLRSSNQDFPVLSVKSERGLDAFERQLCLPGLGVIERKIAMHV